MKKKTKIDPNLIIAIGVLISSFAALFVYMRQASIMNEQTRILLEQTRASTWPHLIIELHRGNSQKGLHSYKYAIANKGTGPAIIETTVISINDQAVGNWNEFYSLLHNPDSIPIGHSYQNIHERVLSANEDLVLIDWSGGNTKLMELIMAHAHKISIEICYKSIHGDTWTVKRIGFQSDLESNIRTKVTECNCEKNKIFRQ